jgi:hypothetical protein
MEGNCYDYYQMTAKVAENMTAKVASNLILST